MRYPETLKKLNNSGFSESFDHSIINTMQDYRTSQPNKRCCGEAGKEGRGGGLKAIGEMDEGTQIIRSYGEFVA